jgi:hypothetical protein
VVSLSDQIRIAVRRSIASQTAIARAAKIDAAALSRFLSGDSCLSLNAVDRLADVLDLRLRASSPKTVRYPMSNKPDLTRFRRRFVKQRFIEVVAVPPTGMTKEHERDLRESWFGDGLVHLHIDSDEYAEQTPDWVYRWAGIENPSKAHT